MAMAEVAVVAVAMAVMVVVAVAMVVTVNTLVADAACCTGQTVNTLVADAACCTGQTAPPCMQPRTAGAASWSASGGGRSAGWVFSVNRRGVPDAPLLLRLGRSRRNLRASASKVGGDYLSNNTSQVGAAQSPPAKPGEA